MEKESETKSLSAQSASENLKVTLENLMRRKIRNS